MAKNRDFGQFLAKKMTKSFIITEVLSLSILFFSSHYLMMFYQVEGVVMGYAISYAVYFLVLFIMFSKTLFATKSWLPSLQISSGACRVFMVSTYKFLRVFSYF